MLGKLIKVYWITCNDCDCFDCQKQGNPPKECRKCKSKDIVVDNDFEEEDW